MEVTLNLSRCLLRAIRLGGSGTEGAAAALRQETERLLGTGVSWRSVECTLRGMRRRGQVCWDWGPDAEPPALTLAGLEYLEAGCPARPERCGEPTDPNPRGVQ